MNQRGIALLMVLCALFLMSATVMTSYHYWLEAYSLVKNGQQRQKEKWILLGAEEKVTSDFIKYISNDTYAYDGFRQLISRLNYVKLNNLNIKAKIIDNTNCFNVKSLRIDIHDTDEIIGYYSWKVFKELLLISGIERDETKNIIYRILKSYHSDLVFDDFADANSGLKSANKINYELNEFNLLSSMNHSDFLKISSILCTRSDNKLLVNINMLKKSNSKYLQAMLLSSVSEQDVYNIILAKPEGGWTDFSLFYNLILANSSMKITSIDKIISDNFTLDEYYFYCIFWLEHEDSSYQLTSFIHYLNNTITILQRRYSFSEQYN